MSSSDFINAMLAEDDVAFVDEQNSRVMCKVCKKYVPLEKPHIPDPAGLRPEDLRRRWKLDWNLHRQSHFMHRVDKASNSGAKPGRFQGSDTRDPFHRHNAPPATVYESHSDFSTTPSTSRSAPAPPILQLRPPHINSNHQVISSHAGPVMEQPRYGGARQDPAARSERHHQVFCNLCQTWIPLDRRVRDGAQEWDMHLQTCPGRRPEVTVYKFKSGDMQRTSTSRSDTRFTPTAAPSTSSGSAIKRSFTEPQPKPPNARNRMSISNLLAGDPVEDKPEKQPQNSPLQKGLKRTAHEAGLAVDLPPPSTYRADRLQSPLTVHSALLPAAQNSRDRPIPHPPPTLWSGSSSSSSGDSPLLPITPHLSQPEPVKTLPAKRKPVKQQRRQTADVIMDTDIQVDCFDLNNPNHEPYAPIQFVTRREEPAPKKPAVREKEKEKEKEPEPLVVLLDPTADAVELIQRQPTPDYGGVWRPSVPRAWIPPPFEELPSYRTQSCVSKA